jgi:hypothetical protein
MIVGAGQAGLQLGMGLLGDGHEVTIASNKTGEELAAGRLLSGQTMFGPALATERALGIDLWQDTCPQLEGKQFALYHPDDPNPVFHWSARLDQKGMSVDQRVKYPAWMDLFQERGGTLQIDQIDTGELEVFAEQYDLVIYAAGRDAGLFAKVPERSPFDRPQKTVAIIAVTGLLPREPWDGVCITIVPGHGENIILPVLCPNGPGHLFVFQYYPGGPWDNWPTINSAEDHLAHSKQLLKDYLPEMYERAKDSEPMDPLCYMRGGVTPVVREPVGVLPSGALVLGLGDAVVVNDPLTAPGANSAAMAAEAYQNAIRAHGDAPYDRAFMAKTFEDFWQTNLKYVTEWNNLMVPGAPEHVTRVLIAGNEYPEIRKRWVNAFGNRKDFFDWLGTPEKADAYLEELRSRPRDQEEALAQ